MKLFSTTGLLDFFTPAYKKPVDDHIIQDETTTRLINDTERLLKRMTDNATGKNERKNIRRRQKDWDIRVKINYNYIRLIVSDTKNSRSPIHKRLRIVCHRKYIKSSNGMGKVKEATIHYLKDGRMHVRSLLNVSHFKGILYGIHQLDLAYVGTKTSEVSLERLSGHEQQLKSEQANDIRVLVQEANRYVQAMDTLSIDPMLDNRLQRILTHVGKLEDDFHLFDFEDKHTVRRLLREDIPNLMGAFFALSKKNQMEQRDNVFVSLSKMELSLIRLTEHLEKTKVERMDHVMRLQELRYGSKTDLQKDE
ncbi:hypothetical protein ACE1TH_05800 [Shouchella sp. JSM 1781072]|uniref:hypothetical protein n=1 Tax=Bacillaceae TaxID=186817 RepID=UPI000C08547C|nr:MULTISPECIES: hypothetical protein [Bacillaceae]UTR08243.1 hypothetical protein MM326_09580 [Alkalihalobacillus sp. LMS6]UTR08330.1 hypothetical protein MM326_10060 [Alkalihalobacillus sp. LMS6]